MTVSVNDILFRWAGERRVNALLLITDGIRLANELEETEPETLKDAIAIVRAFLEAQPKTDKLKMISASLDDIEAGETEA